jgi:hypothetical protein
VPVTTMLAINLSPVSTTPLIKLCFEMTVLEKINSSSVHCNPVASKQNMEKLSVLKVFSFIAEVVDTSD